MKNFFSILCLFMTVICKGQLYNVALIPDSLTKNANMVKRNEEMIIEIKNPGKAKITTKYAYTILNESADRYAVFYDSYDKFQEINSIDGTLYDMFGKELKNVKKKDIGDISDNDGMSLVTDTRYKFHSFYMRTYPYTVEYKETSEMNGIFYLPLWRPQTGPGISLEYCKLTVITPPDYKLRYKQKNLSSVPSIQNAADKIIYSWEIKNVSGKQSERYSPDWSDIVASVLLAPTDFEIQGYSGNMSSWENFGKFRTALLEGRDNLDETTKKKVHELTDNVSDTYQKISILYDYLQNTTRYISIQLGIGGWQPLDAKFVGEKKYGDCKALSNFMGALLKEAGISSYYGVIKAGRDNKSFEENFPSNQFNHIIRCVPVKNDTIWLECTSQTDPLGYLGSFTSDRPVLLIGDDGGKLVRTPKYSAQDNTRSTKISGVISEIGSLNIDITNIYTGIEQDEIYDVIISANKKDLMDYLKEKYSIATYDITSSEYKKVKSRIPSVTEELKLESPHYASITGKRLFVIPNILSQIPEKINASENRQFDIYYKHSFKNNDNISIKIPPGYNIESMPKDVVINNKFGSYEIHFRFEADNITCTRNYTRSEGRFPASDYPELVKFYDSMYKADRSKIVFIKKEG